MKILLFLLTLSLFSCQKQVECNPKEFKTGAFRFEQVVNGKRKLLRLQERKTFKLKLIITEPIPLRYAG